MKKLRSIAGVFAFVLALVAAVAVQAKGLDFLSAWGKHPVTCQAGTIIDTVTCATTVTTNGTCTVQFSDSSTAIAQSTNQCLVKLYRQQP